MCNDVVSNDEFLVFCPPLKVAIIMGIQLLLGESYTVEWDDSIRDEEKIDCYPDQHGASEANCTARGCIWKVIQLKVFVCMDIL